MRCNGAALFLLALVVAALSTCSRQATAHGVDPIGVAVLEHPAGEVRVRIDRPLSLAGAQLDVGIDADCTASGERERELMTARAVDELRFQCGRRLAGRSVRVDGLAATGLDAVFRAELADGTVHRSVVTARTPEVPLPVGPNRAATLLGYLGLGAQHLLLGFDHLLFILGTLLLERRPRRAALALTGFTIGHSFTLAAAVLGFLRIPAAWAEVGIALSLLWLAIAVVRSRADEPRDVRGSVALALVIGLVHGLGFADVLIAVGTPVRELPLALIGFNLGIELTQLVLATAAFLLAALAVRARLPRIAAGRSWLAHGIGVLAVMWCIERVLLVRSLAG